MRKRGLPGRESLLLVLTVSQLCFGGLAFVPTRLLGQGCPNTGKTCGAATCPLPCMVNTSCQSSPGSTFHCPLGNDCPYGSWQIIAQGAGLFCKDTSNQSSTCNASGTPADCLTFAYYTDGACVTPAKCGRANNTCGDGQTLVLTTQTGTCQYGS
jgi:hypothetical protein